MTFKMTPSILTDFHGLDPRERKLHGAHTLSEKVLGPCKNFEVLITSSSAAVHVFIFILSAPPPPKKILCLWHMFRKMNATYLVFDNHNLTFVISLLTILHVNNFS